MFRQKQQNHRGPRTRPDHVCLKALGVSEVLIPLPRCGAALSRNRLRTTELFHPMPFFAFLHASRGAGSDMRGPRLRRPDGRRVKRPLPGSCLKRPAGPPGAVLSEPRKRSEKNKRAHSGSDKRCGPAGIQRQRRPAPRAACNSAMHTNGFCGTTVLASLRPPSVFWSFSTSRKRT